MLIRALPFRECEGFDASVEVNKGYQLLQFKLSFLQNTTATYGQAIGCHMNNETSTFELTKTSQISPSSLEKNYKDTFR